MLACGRVQDQNQGVYFEAGFAQGIGIPVIWSCAESDLGNVHFNVRQYNLLLLKPGGFEEFRTRLLNRIEAVIGVGPLASRSG